LKLEIQEYLFINMYMFYIKSKINGEYPHLTLSSVSYDSSYSFKALYTYSPLYK